MPLTAAQARSRYFTLYRGAARLAWDPAAIDLSRDRADWRRIRAEHAAERYPEQIARLCALFHEGEESVTRTLAPYASAVARAGLGVDVELHLAAQLYEEARHFEFFTRYFAEVLDGEGATGEGATGEGATGEGATGVVATGVDATRDATRDAMAGAPRAVLVDDLQAISERLRREDDPARLGDLLTEGVTHYMGVVEAMLARTGYEGAHEALTKRGWLPGLQEGFRLIRRDEGRHVAFGMLCVRDLVAADPRRAAIVHATFERHLPNVLATVQGFAEYEHLLVDLGALTAFAMRACRQFLAAAGLGDPSDAAALERELDAAVQA